MSEQVVDQFCGIGWGFAMDGLDIVETGIDNEPTVALTRAALGWDTLLADIRDLDPAPWKGIDGLISSPPCQSWSRAGKGAGLDDPRGQLVWQPLVWALACRPRWVACEQVPEAAPAFRLIAHRLREQGYHADVFELSAETFGVPQTRRRVFLTAHYDRKPQRPAATHQRYRKGVDRQEPADMLGHLPWVSMAEAFDDPNMVGARMRYRRGAGMVERYGERPDRTIDEPAFTVTTEGATGGAKHQWLWTNQNSEMGGGRCERYGRSPEYPAPTITGHGGSYTWAAERPSTTEAGTDKPVALTEQQGCTLMAFPAGTHQHLQGSKQDRWRIIGNAVCPPVAQAVLATLTNPEPS